MSAGKGAYLKKITSGMRLRTAQLGEHIEGSTPPSVFIGHANYPKVYAGPMLALQSGDTGIMDTPEQWIPSSISQEKIINYRLNLVRGKALVSVTDLSHRLVESLQEISLASSSVDSEAKFKHRPYGFTFDEEHQPYGPSGTLERFRIDNPKWDHHLQKAYYDIDWKAADALASLYEQGILFSQLQKVLSTGALGVERNRKLVPTRWSITAVDSMLASHLWDRVRYYEIIDNYRVYEYSSLNNYYVVILLPTFWQYEWIEAFIHILGSEEMIFADNEGPRSKTKYSSVGGCYYSCKFAVLESLVQMKKQAGAIVLREAYENYVPLGVFNVRENIRMALKQNHRKFHDFRDSLNYVSTRLRLPISRFVEQGSLLRQMLSGIRQTIL